MAKKEPKFEDSMAELESILEQLEGGDLALDAMMERYEKGVTALGRCRKILDRAEKKIEILVKGEDEKLKPEPFKTHGEQ